jgi:hypothetical protein
VQIGRPGHFKEYEKQCARALQAAALRASDKAAKQATADIRQAMRGAGLGRLSNAIGTGSDLKKRGTGYKRGGDAFSASGWVHVRGKSKRTTGALEAYTQGADIKPRRGGWLWIPTKQITGKVGRQKMTPALYRASGMEEKLGPLVQIQTSPGEALLIVQSVSVDKFAGAGRKARRIGKRLGKDRRRAYMVVAFVGIRRTSRAARVTPSSIIAATAARLPDLVTAKLAKET